MSAVLDMLPMGPSKNSRGTLFDGRGISSQNSDMSGLRSISGSDLGMLVPARSVSEFSFRAAHQKSVSMEEIPFPDAQEVAVAAKEADNRAAEAKSAASRTPYGGTIVSQEPVVPGGVPPHTTMPPHTELLQHVASSVDPNNGYVPFELVEGKAVSPASSTALPPQRSATTPTAQAAGGDGYVSFVRGEGKAVSPASSTALPPQGSTTAPTAQAAGGDGYVSFVRGEGKAVSPASKQSTATTPSGYVPLTRTGSGNTLSLKPELETRDHAKTDLHVSTSSSSRTLPMAATSSRRVSKGTFSKMTEL